jgi:hypothetical protein
VRVFRSHFFPFLNRTPFDGIRTYCISQYSIVCLICHDKRRQFMHDPGMSAVNCRICTS